MDEKIDHEEVRQIRGYIDTRFKNFKPKLPEMAQPVDTAAASRKKLLTNCNCISCDRPVDIPLTHAGMTITEF